MACPTNPLCHVTGTAFITGSGSGLALADVNLASLEKVQAELNKQYPDVRVEVFAMDVTKEAEISAAVQSAASKFGRIDISIQGAGITGFPAATHESSLEAWQPVIDINLTGVMLCDKWMVGQMLTQDLRPGYEGRGMIVNIASILGISAPDPSIGAVAYTAAKHAVVGLTKLDAKMYAPHGIRINAICPGYADTPMTHRDLASQRLNVEIEKTALKRPAKAEELASAILFLTCRMGSYMCTNTLVVDGGYTA
ncbi:hypothetical protein BJY00DRAFT_299721 [Aspergillus carlsbadensis]|nr:hypothetical protein BJY00DRAFT_299721 [Aspergillus carlsbadensis]